MKEFFGKVAGWFNEPTNLPWIIAYSVGLLLLIVIIVTIVLAVKLRNRKKDLHKMDLNLKISKDNISVLTRDKEDLSVMSEKRFIQIQNLSKEIDMLKSEKNKMDTELATAKAADIKLTGELKTANDKLAVFENNIETLSLENSSLKKHIEELAKQKTNVLEPEVSAIDINEADDDRKSVSKTGRFKYTLSKLNEVCSALGLRERKTKQEAADAIKATILDKKLTKPQVLQAMKAIGMSQPSSAITKDKLIEQLKKELTK